MKVTIDENKKTIEIYESVNLNELFNYLKKLNINLEDYTLVIKPSIVIDLTRRDDFDGVPTKSPWQPYNPPCPTTPLYPKWWESPIICKTTYTLN